MKHQSFCKCKNRPATATSKTTKPQKKKSSWFWLFLYLLALGPQDDMLLVSESFLNDGQLTLVLVSSYIMVYHGLSWWIEDRSAIFLNCRWLKELSERWQLWQLVRKLKMRSSSSWQRRCLPKKRIWRHWFRTERERALHVDLRLGRFVFFGWPPFLACSTISSS